jgi:hypothetical protein
VQRPMTSGPRGWPAGPTLEALMGWFYSDTLQEAVEGNPILKVSGGELHGRLATWLGQPATTWRVTDLTMSVTPPWTPINTPLPVEIKAAHSTCSSPHVNILVWSSSAGEARSGVESQVKHLLELQR